MPEQNNLNGDHLIAVIPAYNEERFIGSVVLKACRHAQTVIVVDDGSADATAEVARAAGAVVLRHETNRGKGAALATGFKHACQMGADLVVTFDADGQHLPRQLDRVVHPVRCGEADLVVGSRYLRPDGRTPLHRVWGHRLFNTLTNLLSGVPVSDSQSGFRAFSRPAVEALSLKSSGFSVESEMQLLASSLGLVVKEVPVTIRYDDRPKRSVWRHGLLVLNGLLRLVGQYRPLLFFGLSGLFLMALGGTWGIYVVDIFHRTGDLAMGYALISVFLFIVGSISFSTGIILHSTRALLIEHLSKIRKKDD